jgi:ribonuclease E
VIDRGEFVEQKIASHGGNEAGDMSQTQTRAVSVASGFDLSAEQGGQDKPSVSDAGESDENIPANETALETEERAKRRRKRRRGGRGRDERAGGTEQEQQTREMQTNFSNNEGVQDFVADAAPAREESVAIVETVAIKEPVPQTSLEVEPHPEKEPVSVVLTPPAEGPKRSGWWAKARSAITGA